MCYKGSYAACQLARLQHYVVSIDSSVECDLVCETDNQGLLLLSGIVRAEITLCCQRCSQPFPHVLSVELALSPVADETQSDMLPLQYEPIAINDVGEIDLLAAIEDAIILALPMIALHADALCQRDSTKMIFGELDDTQSASGPFSSLAGLKKSN